MKTHFCFAQAFRVFHRIANVMAGVGDTPDMASGAAAHGLMTPAM